MNKAERRGDVRGQSRSGHTIIELLVAFVILIVGAFGFLKVIVSTSTASDVNHEVALAKEAARAQIEELLGLDYQQAFVRFNQTTADDPGGGVISPGSGFAVEGLQLADNDPDGLAGEIIFPTHSTSPGAIREDLANQALGCPMDLNGDQVIDSADHSGDFLILPVLVRVTWKGDSGECSTQFKTILGALQ